MPLGASFWTFGMQFNYVNINPEGVLAEGLGWKETFHINSPSSDPPIALCQNINAARIALMANNVTVKRTTLSQSVRYRDQWPIGVVANTGLNTLGDINDPSVGDCNAVQDALLIRFEGAGGRRWTRTIRGIRDAWIDDQTWLPSLTTLSYGTLVPPDTVVPTIIPFNVATVGVAGVVTITVAGGVVTATVASTLGSGLAFNNNVNGTGNFYVTNDLAPGIENGSGSYTTLNIVLTAGSLTLLGTTFTAGTQLLNNGTYTFVIKPAVQSNQLPYFLADSAYLLNFCAWMLPQSTVGLFQVINFNMAMFDNNPTPTPGWPVKSQTPYINADPPFAGNPTGFPAARFMIERVTNRQTGRINLTKAARRKIAR
jgi:hypothetical protein